MAFSLVVEVLDHAPEMTPAEGLILLAIAEETRRPGDVVGISSDTMARRTRGMGARGIRHALTRLAERGIEVRVPIGKGDDGRTLYTVPGCVPKYQLPRFPAPPGCGCSNCSTTTSQKADAQVPLPSRQADPQVPLDENQQVTGGGPTGPPTEVGGPTGPSEGLTSPPEGPTGPPEGPTGPPFSVRTVPSLSATASGAREEREKTHRNDQPRTPNLTATLASTYDATPNEVSAVLAAARRDGIRNLTAWLSSRAGQEDFPSRLAEHRHATTRTATTPLGCEQCRGGWIGEDDDIARKPCLRCKPHLARRFEGVR